MKYSERGFRRRCCWNPNKCIQQLVPKGKVENTKTFPSVTVPTYMTSEVMDRDHNKQTPSKTTVLLPTRNVIWTRRGRFQFQLNSLEPGLPNEKKHQWNNKPNPKISAKLKIHIDQPSYGNFLCKWVGKTSTICNDSIWARQIWWHHTDCIEKECPWTWNHHGKVFPSLPVTAWENNQSKPCLLSSVQTTLWANTVTLNQSFGLLSLSQKDMLTPKN